LLPLCFVSLDAFHVPDIVAERMISRVLSFVAGRECGNTQAVRRVLSALRNATAGQLMHWTVVIFGCVVTRCSTPYAPSKGDWLLFCKEAGTCGPRCRFQHSLQTVGTTRVGGLRYDQEKRWYGMRNALSAWVQRAMRLGARSSSGPWCARIGNMTGCYGTLCGPFTRTYEETFSF
jgi:hypothetical protein